MLESFIRHEHARWDTGTHHEVVIDDCYRVKNRRFAESDTILDVGANIGLFSGLALELGAGFVMAVEPSPQNYTAAYKNLAPYLPRVFVIHAAVWRSDESARLIRIHEFPEDGNTGGLSVLLDQGEVAVTTIGLDELIEDRSITFLKMDCEGSEYPILYTSQKLGQVREIALELHPVEHLLKDGANPRPGKNDPKSMAKYLTALGFNVQLEARPGMDPGWAYIWANR